MLIADTTRRLKRQDMAVSLSRIAWILTVLICLVIGLVLLLDHYQGYPAIALAIAVAAAINLL
jgi:hypothetical protein